MEIYFLAIAIGFGVGVAILAYYVTYNAFREKSKGNKEE
jgi:hypothetical protein